MAIDINSLTYDQLLAILDRNRNDENGGYNPYIREIPGLTVTRNNYDNGDPIMALHNAATDQGAGGQGWNLVRNPDGSIGRQEYTYDSEMGMVAPLLMATMPFWAPALGGLFGAATGGTTAATGSLAEAMATYAPGWWEGVTAAGMGEAGLSAGLTEMMAAAGTAGIPEASLAEVMAQTNPSWWSDVTAAGMGDPGFAVGLTDAGLTVTPETLSESLSTSGGSSAGSSASGAGEAANPASFSDARYAAQTGIDPSYVGPGTASASLTSTLTQAGNTARDILSNPLTQVAGSVISGVLSNNAAEDAANAQLAGINAGIAEQRRQYDQTRADLAPYRERGYQANNRLAVMMGQRPNVTTYGNGDPTQDPNWNKGYQTAPTYQPGETANALSRYLRPLNRG